MDLDRNIAAEIAKFYFNTEAALVPLGWGVSGYVYLSPDLLTAVKVHRYQEGFERELETYLMLRRLRITNLHGLTIPKLRDYRTDLKLIKMDFVKPRTCSTSPALVSILPTSRTMSWNGGTRTLWRCSDRTFQWRMRCIIPSRNTASTT